MKGSRLKHYALRSAAWSIAAAIGALALPSIASAVTWGGGGGGSGYVNEPCTTSLVNEVDANTAGLAPPWACHADSIALHDFIVQIFHHTAPESSGKSLNCSSMTDETHQVQVGDNSLGDFVYGYSAGEFAGADPYNWADTQLVINAILDDNAIPASSCVSPYSVNGFEQRIAGDLVNGDFVTQADQQVANNLMLYLGYISNYVQDFGTIWHYQNFSSGDLGIYVNHNFGYEESDAGVVRGWDSIGQAQSTGGTEAQVACLAQSDHGDADAQTAVDDATLILQEPNINGNYFSALSDMLSQYASPGVYADPCASTTHATHIESWNWVQ